MQEQAKVTSYLKRVDAISLAEKEGLDSQIEDLIDLLDDKSIQDLLSVVGDDYEKLLEILAEETNNVVNLKQFDKSLTTCTIQGLPNLQEGFEVYLRKKNLAYFTFSCLPDFELAYHTLEWFSMIQLYQKLNVIAARDHCFGINTPVLMANGDIKMVQDIKVGDKVMGPDSKPREVLSFHSGNGTLYKINQSRGDSYVVNSNHILSLYRVKESIGKGEYKSAYLDDVPIEKYLAGNKQYRTDRRGYKVTIHYPEQEVLLEPYYLGLWLGDGNSHDQGITSADIEVEKYLSRYAKRIGYNLRKVESEGANSYWITIPECYRGKRVKHYLLEGLRKYNLLKNKHIPEEYLKNSKEVRLQLLAGLIDSDGSVSDNILYYTTIDRQLSLDIKRLADSLGYRTYWTERTDYIKYLKKDYVTYQVTISGLLDEIPTRLSRKRVRFNHKGSCYYKPQGFGEYDISLISGLKVESIGFGEYFGFETDGDHRFCLGDSTVVHNSKSFCFSFAVPLWRLYRYIKPDGFSVLPDDIKFYREGMIITNEYKLAKKLLKKVKEEIKFNPILSKALYPQGDEGNWASESIACKNGAEITLSSYRTSNRGPHPGWITVDDFLDRSAMYSKDQRESFKESFNAEIMNMILPQGTIDVVGTPFHEKDLYSDLKMDPNWRVFEYPAVFPDGSVLWANRYSFEALKAKRLSLGPLIFSREILVRPISDSTSIFPWSLLEKAFLGMKDYCLVKNRASFPIKFRKVAIGVDWALSATVAADFTEMTVLGEDFQGDLWLLEERTLHGAGYNQQIAELQALNVAYGADVIMVEVNGFQKVMSGLATEAGLTNIVEETTTGHTKKDFYEGLPAIAVLFERGKMHFPRGDEYSIEKTNEICSQLNSMAFDEDRGTLESVGTHDDKSMSLYFAVKGIKSVNGIFRVGSTL